MTVDVSVVHVDMFPFATVSLRHAGLNCCDGRHDDLLKVINFVDCVAVGGPTRCHDISGGTFAIRGISHLWLSRSRVIRRRIVTFL